MNMRPTETVPPAVTQTLEQAALARGEASRQNGRVVYGAGSAAVTSELQRVDDPLALTRQYVSEAFDRRSL